MGTGLAVALARPTPRNDLNLGRYRNGRRMVGDG